MTRRARALVPISRFAAWLLLPLLAAGCGALRRPPPSVDRSQDARILEDLRARLATEPAINAAQIRVEVDGGAVLLYGSVQGMGAWNCTLRNAELVDGVRTVVDYLILERGPREAVCLAHRGSSQ